MGDRYPAFSGPEMARRRRAIDDLMAEQGLDHLLVYEADRAGSAIQWLTGWPVTREGALLASPGATDLLLVQFYNHVPNARALAPAAEVRWGGVSTAASLAGELERRSAGRVGLFGSLPHRMQERLAASGAELVDLNPEYARLRMLKSEEEIEWLRRGAELSDRAVYALLEAQAGVSELELAALIESSYLAAGGTTHIHYLGSTSMANPDLCVPAQYPSARRLHQGDVLLTELSASYWGYPGQVLRTFSVASEPTPLYQELHAVAEQAFRAVIGRLREGARAEEIVEAASLIEEAGFTTYDDLLHGFGGGYLPPVLGSRSRQNEPLPDFELRAGMTLVVQPNVITPDQRAGVQTGELVLVTASGVERLHAAPRGLLRIG